jgi:hypothetical protein
MLERAGDKLALLGETASVVRVRGEDAPPGSATVAFTGADAPDGRLKAAPGTGTATAADGLRMILCRDRENIAKSSTWSARRVVAWGTDDGAGTGRTLVSLRSRTEAGAGEPESGEVPVDREAAEDVVEGSGEERDTSFPKAKRGLSEPDSVRPGTCTLLLLYRDTSLEAKVDRAAACFTRRNCRKNHVPTSAIIVEKFMTTRRAVITHCSGVMSTASWEINDGSVTSNCSRAVEIVAVANTAPKLHVSSTLNNDLVYG